LRREVASLLAAHEAAGDFIESPPAEAIQMNGVFVFSLSRSVPFFTRM
jgi:hypothetical protein